MSKDVFDLAEENTTLSKQAKSEYAGSCPNPNCRCQTDGFRVRLFEDKRKKQDVWKWMCRGCYDAAEWLPDKGRKRGWGDEIDYLRHYHGMTYKAALRYINDGTVEEDKAERTIKRNQTVPGDPDDLWQKKYARYVPAAENRLWDSEGREGVDYLYSRGLTEPTIKAAHLGYAVRNGRPCIVIPWYDSRESGYWRVSLRDITPGTPKEQRYKNTLPGFSHDGLYLGDSLKRKLPTFLVEGEFDALSIAQKAGDLVNVVATGSTGNARVAKWELRLACMPSVLVAFDRSPDGDNAAQHWLRILNGATKVLRYRTLAHDANDMLVQGYDVRTWVLAALDYLSDQDDQDTSSQDGTPRTLGTLGTPTSDQDALPAQEPEQWFCSSCGVDLNTIDTGAYGEDGLPYCNLDPDTKEAYCSRKTTYEQFLAYANRFATGLTEQTGEHWTITPIPPGYTLKQHVAKLNQQAKETYRRSLLQRSKRRSSNKAG